MTDHELSQELALSKSPAARLCLLEALYRGPMNVDAEGNILRDTFGAPVYGPGLIDKETFLRFLQMPTPTRLDP